MRMLFALIAAIAVLMAGCGAIEVGGADCGTVGATQDCVCSGASVGGQVCLASGNWGDCDCGGQDAFVGDAQADSSAPDVSADTAMPDTAMPDTSVPDTTMPDTSVPDTTMPDTSVPDTSIPDTGTDVGCVAQPTDLCGNSVDDDCDGVTDEGCPCDYLGSTSGVCLGGGAMDGFGTCSPPAAYEATEVSCLGLDNDCDGATDEGCPCDYLGLSTGVCAGGATVDDSGACSTVPDKYQATETNCDGLDNDCDGGTDALCDYTPCPDGDISSCPAGTVICVNEPGFGSACAPGCSGGLSGCPLEDLPDGTLGCWGNGSVSYCGYGCMTDADCPKNLVCRNQNGPYVCVWPSESCDYLGSTVGVCGGGGTVDAGGGCSIAPPDYESAETLCDNVDNDCDGLVDELCDHQPCPGGDITACPSEAVICVYTSGVGSICAPGCSGGLSACPLDPLADGTLGCWGNGSVSYCGYGCMTDADCPQELVCRNQSGPYVCVWP